ncbi:hypothetical protein Tcan_07737 [Toxocara canis]|uniref:Uncharacterized protein n=1 Tax=Toxocara canis TaxID=6265 RepID=A0A0B2UV07_TOXCA|nr:hypothetical protein Tcan_07737 [Toxocara canis]
MGIELWKRHRFMEQAATPQTHEQITVFEIYVSVMDVDDLRSKQWYKEGRVQEMMRVHCGQLKQTAPNEQFQRLHIG